MAISLPERLEADACKVDELTPRQIVELLDRYVVGQRAAKRAVARIEALTREAEVGGIYTGKVTRLMTFGAFVEILPGKDGLVHISELSTERVESVEDVVDVGDEFTVKVIEIDAMGRVNLSRRVLLDPATEAEAREARASRPRPERSGRGYGNDRPGGRGGPRGGFRDDRPRGPRPSGPRPPMQGDRRPPPGGPPR